MLKIENLSFGFGARRLFANLSFEAKPGQLIHIAGANGVGKSTLLSVLAGTLTPQSGSVNYLRSPNDTEGVLDARQYLEYLPAEANGLYLAMSAQENLSFWQKLRHGKTYPKEISDALAAWNLNQPWLTLGFPVSKFSTGMKRRLALVRLALAKVPCWILDEPVYGLDEQAVHSFRMLLQQHLETNGIAILVSHDLTALQGLDYKTVNLGVRTRG